MGVFSFEVIIPVVPPAPEWVVKLDTTWWEPKTFDTMWNGSAWVPNGPPDSVAVKEIGVWNISYRPTKVRITGTVNNPNTITVWDTNSNALGSAATGTSVEIDLTFGPFDIDHIDLYGMAAVTNIEFLEA